MTDAMATRHAMPLAQALTRPIRLVKLTRVTGESVADGRDELTPAQVAEELGVSASTVRRYEERGIISPTRRLPGSGYRRYSREVVDEAKRRIAAGEFDEGD